MNKEYFNIIVNNPRYKRLIAIWASSIIVMTIAIIFFSFSSLARKKAEMSSGEFAIQQARAVQNARFLGGYGLFTTALLLFMAGTKMKSRIVLSQDGIEQREFLRKTLIPWGEIKELKLVNPGSSFEKCRIKGKEKDIYFTPYYLEVSGDFRVEKNGVFDSRGSQITGSVKKSRLYKEIKMRLGE